MQKRRNQNPTQRIVTPKQYLDDNTVILESEISDGPEVPELLDFWPEVEPEVLEAIINKDSDDEKIEVSWKEEELPAEDHEEL